MIRELLRDWVETKKQAPGIVVGVIDEKGTNVFSHGTLEKAGQKAVTGDTVFEIGSLTKVYTSLLLADMVQRGEVKLEDPVSKYLPESVKVPARDGKEITLLHLATHTSALPRLPSNLSPFTAGFSADNPYARYTVEQMYSFLSEHKLRREIGSKYEYSNYGAGLLGHLLALKAGTNYEALVKERICRPLGMSNTYITLTPELKLRMAKGHNASGKPVSNWDIPTLAGAGALRSTVNDQLIFLGANLGIVKSALRPAMEMQHTPRHEAGGPKMHIGLGWHISQKGSLEMIWHNGGTGGYHSFAGFIKKTGRGVVVLSNSANGNEEIGEVILGFRKPPASPSSN